MSERSYYESSIVRTDGTFGGNMVLAKGALCPDGKRRNAHPSSDGIADTFFSIPAFVYVGKVRVYGYVSLETLEGFSVEIDRDPLTVKFIPYLYRKHHALVS